MIDVYTWPTPNGYKIHIMLEECNIAHVSHGVNIRAGEQFHEEFLKISPNNRIPAIIDHNGPDGSPYSVFESGAILIYLAEKTGKFLASEGTERHETLQWLMFQMANVGPMFGQAAHFQNYAPEKIDYAISRYNNETDRLFRIMEKRLGEHPYLAGKTYSIADIAVFPWCRDVQRRGQDIDQLPGMRRWIDEIEARPAVEKALKSLSQYQRIIDTKFDEDAKDNMFGAKQFVVR